MMDAVARNHGGFEGPSIDEDSGAMRQDRDREHVGDLDAGDLLGAVMKLEGKDGDDSVEGAKETPSKTEMVLVIKAIMACAWTSPMESGAGSSGSMGGFGIDSAGAGLGEWCSWGYVFMVPDRAGIAQWKATRREVMDVS